MFEKFKVWVTENPKKAAVLGLIVAAILLSNLGAF